MAHNITPARNPVKINSSDPFFRFYQKYRNILTDDGTVVHIFGQNHYSASVSLFEFKPVRDSEKKTISRTTALASFRKRLMKDGDDVNSKRILDSLDKQPPPRLKLVWSPRANRGPISENVLAPTWVIDKEGLMMVDGHTGEVWYND